MTADGFALGVDLGTSNTVAVLRWPDGRTRPLLFDGVPVMPSAVYLDPSGVLHVGRDALRMAALDPARLEPNPKRRVDEATVLLGNQEVSTVDLLGALLAAVARAAVEACGFLPPAALTYPASWGSARRSVLANAAGRAGWPQPRFVPEPVAAARYFADVLRRPVPVGAAIAVFDFGGGTLDIAVVQNTGNGFGVLGAGGIEDLGGLDVDAALVEHLGRLLADTSPGVWVALARPDSATRLRDRGRFWDDVRGAKEMLSRSAVAPVAVPGLEQAVHLTREELDRIAGPLMQRAVYETAAVIQRCGLRPDQLAGLFLVGGSSRLPIVARLLHAHLGIAPTVLEQPELPVAEGALAEVVPPPASAAMMLVGAAPTSAPPVPTSGAPASGVPASAPPVPASPPPAVPIPTSPPPPGALPVPTPSSPPPVLAKPRRPWYRHWVTWVAAGVAVLLVAVTTVALLMRQPYQEVTFASLSEWARVPTDAKSISYASTAVNGDRAFLAYQQDDGLHIIGYDLAAKTKKWSYTVKKSGGSSFSWKGLRALPDMVLAEANQYTGDKPYTLYAVDWSGNLRWQYSFAAGDDDYVVTKSAVVFMDDKGQRLVGLDPQNGREKWSLPNIKDHYGYSKNLLARVYTAADSDGPADLNGYPADPIDDARLVELSIDSSARLVDTSSGTVTKTHGNIGDPRQAVMSAYVDRLYVAADKNKYQVLSYDLNALDKGKLVYAASDANHRLSKIVPCGTAICLLDETNSDHETARVIAIDPGSASVKWQRPVPGADVLVPLGTGVLAQNTNSSSNYTTVFGGDGAVLLGDQGKDQTGVRVAGGSILLFSSAFVTYPGDESLYGFSVGSHTRTPLGDVKKVRSANCSWNTRLLVCPADDDFGIWRFAS